MSENQHYVYCLQSTVSRRTYVGYSIDPFKRLRKHNGEIAGGAKYTTKGRPWVIQYLCGGFPGQRAGLRFEKRWHMIRKKGRLSLEEQLEKLFRLYTPEVIGITNGTLWIQKYCYQPSAAKLKKSTSTSLPLRYQYQVSPMIEYQCHQWRYGVGVVYAYSIV